jgi:hypothetical protein
MICRHCQAKIADKAIVCYRCGTPTAAPAPVAPVRATSGGVAWILMLLVAVAAAVTWWVRPGAYTEAERVVAAVVGVGALVLALVLRARRRR